MVSRTTHIHIHSNRRRTWPASKPAADAGPIRGMVPERLRDDGPIWRGHSADPSKDAPMPHQREQVAFRLISECLQRLSAINLDFDPEAERLLDKAEMALEAIRSRFKKHG